MMFLQGHHLHFTVPVILTLSFLACSICSSGAVVIHFLFKKSSLSDTASRLLFCLSLSDLIGAVVWFLDIVLPGVLCPFSGVVNLWGYQSAQFWTCVIGAYLIITCSAKLPPNELIFYAIAWGIPSIIQVIMVCLHLYKLHPEPQGCWVQYGTIVIAFVTFPQILSAMLNLIFLGTIVYKMRISAKRWGLQSRDRGLFFVMICYLLTTVSAILESVPNAPHQVYMVAICFGALQGFFNSIAMKQKAILQFLGGVKTIFIPHKEKTKFSRDYSSSPSTWLLVDSSSPSYHAKSLSFQTSNSLSSSGSLSRSTPNSNSSPNSSSSSTPTHPAMSNSYKNFYNQINLKQSLGMSHANNNNNGDNTMDDFSSSLRSSQNASPPSPLTIHRAPPSLSFAPAPLSPEIISPPSIN